MTPSVQAEQERADRELQAARMLLEGGLTEQAVSRAYYAAFHSAQAALLSVGQARSKHGGVLAAFGQHVVRAGGLDPRHGRTLHVLLDQSNAADYRLEAQSQEAAKRAVEWAVAFVEAVAVWLDSRATST